MAKRSTQKPVTLPGAPFEWETTGRHLLTATDKPGAKRARIFGTAPLARGAVQPDAVVEYERGEDGLFTTGKDGRMIARRARVWRTAQPPLLRMVPPAGRAALLDYAEAVEGVLASGGSSVPEGGGRGAPSSASPSAAKLMAAERLRHMREALADGVAVLFPARATSAALRRRAGVPVRFTDLADWVAVEGMSRAQILARVGVSGEAAKDDLSVAIVACAARLAFHCGYVTAPNAGRKSGSGAGGRI